MTCPDPWHQFGRRPANPGQPCPSCMTWIGRTKPQPANGALFDLEGTA